MVQSCPLLLVPSVPSPTLTISLLYALAQPSPCMKDMRMRHMGQEAGIQLREMVLAQQSAWEPLLTCQLALAKLTAFWEGVGLLQKGCQ